MFPKGQIILSVLYAISLIKCSGAGSTDIETETTMMNFLVEGILEDSVNHSKIEEEKQEESKGISSNSLFYDQLEEINKELSMEIVTHIPWNIIPLNSTESQDTTTTTTTTTTAEESETLLPCVLEKSWCLIIIICAIACALIFIRIFIFLEERKNIFPCEEPYGPVHDSIV